MFDGTRSTQPGPGAGRRPFEILSFFRMATAKAPTMALLLAALLLLVPAALPAHAAALLQETPQVYTGGFNVWYPLFPGQTADWTFQYTGQGNLALVAFGDFPTNSLSVSVYDDGQWQLMATGRTGFTPIGRGTTGTTWGWTYPQYQPLITTGNLFWEAKAAPAVLFHSEVTDSSQKAIGYWIAQAGPGAGGLSTTLPGAIPGASSQ